jgi:hypothetical protein
MQEQCPGVSVHSSVVTSVQRVAEVRAKTWGWASPKNGPKTRLLPNRSEITGHGLTAESLGSLVLSGGEFLYRLSDGMEITNPFFTHS